MKSLLAYICRFDPSFQGWIEGASCEGIARLEDLAGVPLPPEYREYLGLMGCKDGGLGLGHHGANDVRSLIEYYETQDVERRFFNGHVPAPRGCLVIATEDPGAGCIYLSDSPRQGMRVFYGFVDEPLKPMAESLTKLLWQVAFRTYRCRVLPHKEYLSTPYDGMRWLEALAEVAKQQGYSRLHFSDSVTFCAEKEGAAVAITQFPEMSFSALMAGHAAAETGRLRHAFEERLQSLR